MKDTSVDVNAFTNTIEIVRSNFILRATIAAVFACCYNFGELQGDAQISHGDVATFKCILLCKVRAFIHVWLARSIGNLCG